MNKKFIGTMIGLGGTIIGLILIQSKLEREAVIKAYREMNKYKNSSENELAVMIADVEHKDSEVKEAIKGIKESENNMKKCAVFVEGTEEFEELNAIYGNQEERAIETIILNSSYKDKYLELKKERDELNDKLKSISKTMEGIENSEEIVKRSNEVVNELADIESKAIDECFNMGGNDNE